jgi:hypothetical protein
MIDDEKLNADENDVQTSRTRGSSKQTLDKRKGAEFLISSLISCYPNSTASEWVRWLDVKHYSSFSSWQKGQKAIPAAFLAKIFLMLSLPESKRPIVYEKLRKSKNPTLFINMLTSFFSSSLMLKELVDKEFVESLFSDTQEEKLIQNLVLQSDELKKALGNDSDPKAEAAEVVGAVGGALGGAAALGAAGPVVAGAVGAAGGTILGLLLMAAAPIGAAALMGAAAYSMFREKMAFAPMMISDSVNALKSYVVELNKTK